MRELGITILLLVVLYLLLSCAAPLSPSAIDPWWPEAELRSAQWLSENPQCPKSYVKPSVSIVNEKPTLRGAACEYSPSNRLIRAPEPYFSETRFGLGCIPHELMHAALHQANNPCWRLP